jgi:hypothetical protein
MRLSINQIWGRTHVRYSQAMGRTWHNDELRRLYVDEGLSLSAIGLRYGCSLVTIWRHLKAAGIETRPDGGTPRYLRVEAAVRVDAGYVNGAGVNSNGVLWGFGVSRKDSLRALFTRINPYLRHPRRRRDMIAAWSTL